MAVHLALYTAKIFAKQYEKGAFTEVAIYATSVKMKLIKRENMNKYTELFVSMLDVIEFDLVKRVKYCIKASKEDTDEFGFHLILNGYDIAWSEDKKSFEAESEQISYIETIMNDRGIDFSRDSYVFCLYDRQGVNLGDIDLCRFHTAEEVIERLDVYIEDYYRSDLADELIEYGLDRENTPECESEWVEFEKNSSGKPEYEKFIKEHRHEFDVMNLIAYHLGDIDLNEIVSYAES